MTKRKVLLQLKTERPPSVVWKPKELDNRKTLERIRFVKERILGDELYFRAIDRQNRNHNRHLIHHRHWDGKLVLCFESARDICRCV